MPSGRTRGSRLLPWALALSLALLAVGVHLGVTDHQLLNYDDDIDLNPEIPGLMAGLSAPGIAWAATSVEHANWMPLTRLTWLVDISLFGYGARSFLLGNLFYHVVATVLLFAALRSLTGAAVRSALVAAIFAVHPLHVESIAWAAERKDVVCGAFWMATLLAYSAWVQRPSFARYGLVFAAMALALLAKPMAVTLPFVLVLLDVWPLGRVQTDSVRSALRTLRRAFLEKLPLFALVVASALVTLYVQREGNAIRDLDLFPLPARLANAALAPWIYLRKFIWPTDLAVFYPHPGDAVSYPAAWLAAFALVLVTVLALLAARRRPYVTVGWLWFLGTLLPVIGILQVGFQALADRYMYVPLVGVAIPLVWGGAELADRMRLGLALRTGTCAAIVAALAFGSVVQTRHWKDSEMLFLHALDVTEGNWLAHQNLSGVALHRKDYAAAAAHLAESVRIEPRNPATWLSYGSVLLHLGQKKEGLEALHKGITLAPDLDESARTKALAELEANIAAETTESVEDSISPEPGQDAAGEGSEETALARPGMPGIHGELGAALLRAGRNEEAERVLSEAIQREPNVAAWRASHGDVLQRLGRSADAVAAYREALRLQSPWPEIENNLALILATDPDAALRNPAEAVRLAEAAVAALGRGDPGSLDTLAAAYAAAGRRREALATAHEALALAEAAGNEDAIDAIHSRIEALTGKSRD